MARTFYLAEIDKDMDIHKLEADHKILSYVEAQDIAYEWLESNPHSWAVIIYHNAHAAYILTRFSPVYQEIKKRLPGT